jgi:3-hydroxyacyl-CoA dehydrogenase
VLAKLKEYGERMGAGFAVSPLLERMAAGGKAFTK